MAERFDEIAHLADMIAIVQRKPRDDISDGLGARAETVGGRVIVSSSSVASFACTLSAGAAM